MKSKFISDISNNILFKGIEKNQLERLDENFFVYCTYSKNETLFLKGEPSSHIFLILEGEVKVVNTENEDNIEVLLSIKKAGDSLGELSFILKEPRTATVISISKIKAIKIKTDNFLKILEAPKIGSNVFKAIAKIVIKSDNKISEEVLKNETIMQLNSELNIQKNELEKSYLTLKEAQDKILKLERNNSILAMIVTANHEINQPLTVASVNLQMLQKMIEKVNLGTDSDSITAKTTLISNNLDKINKILAKYRDKKDFVFSDYGHGIKMINFDNETI